MKSVRYGGMSMKSFRLLLICLFFAHNASVTAVYAEIVDYRSICQSIRQAEGNANYGVINGSCDVKEPGMCKYMCEEIVQINFKRWLKRPYHDTREFLVFLRDRYCPIGAKNDPTGLNKNWLRLVKYFLAKQ